MTTRKRDRRAWVNDPDLVALAASRKTTRRDPRVVGDAWGTEIPVSDEQVVRLGTFTVRWVIDYVAKQQELPLRQRVALGTFLLDLGPKRVGDMKSLASHAKALVQWGSRRRLRHLTGVGLLDPTVLPRFMQACIDDHVSLDTYNARRLSLLKLAEDLYPDGDFSDVPPGAWSGPVGPIDEHTFQAQCEQANAIRDLELQRTVKAGLYVPRSCGMAESPLGGVVGPDFYLDDTNHLRIRRSTGGEPYAVLERFRSVVYDLRLLAGQGPLLAVGVGNGNITGNLGMRLDRAGWDPVVPKPSVKPLVSAYRAEMALRVNARRLKSLCGDVSLRSFDRLLESLPVEAADPRADIFGESALPIWFYRPNNS